MINFLLCIVLPPGASEVEQTHKFDNFLDLTIRNKVQVTNVSIVEKDISFNSVWLKKTEVIFHLINYLSYTIKT